jgi:tape measure domain-containing protein
MEVGKLWATLGLNKSEYDKGVDDAKGQGSGLAGFLKGAFQFAVGQGIFETLKQGIKSAWDSSIGFNSTMQQNRIAFETMLGSADAAGKVLNDLAAFAAATPFELPDLTNASKKMLAFGFSSEQIMPMLKSVGDATAGLGMSGKEGLDRIILALGQTRAAGKLTGDNLRQLVEAGIPVWDILGKGFNKTTGEIQDMVSKGLIPADQGIDILVKGMEERFPNMMEKQSKSFAGLMATLKDNVNMTLGGIMKPAFEWLTAVALPKGIELVEQLSGAFEAGGLRGLLAEIFPASVVNILTGLGEAIGNSLGWIAQHGDEVKGTLTAIVGAFVAYRTAVLAATVAQEAQNAVSALMAIAKGREAAAEALATTAKKGSTVAQWLLNTAMNANPLLLVITLIGALVAGIIYLWNTNEGLRNALIGAWTAVSDAAVSVWTGIRDFFIGLWDALKEFFGNWGVELLAVIAPFIGIPLLIIKHWDEIKNFLSAIWTQITESITSIITGFVNSVQAIVKGFVEAIVGFFQWLYNHNYYFKDLVDFIINIFNILRNTITVIWNAIVQFFSLVMGNIQLAFTTAWEAIAAFLATVWNGISLAATAAWTGISAFFTTIVNAIKAAFEWVWSQITNIWNGIWETITSIGGGIKDSVIGIFNSIKDTVAGIIADAWNWGANLVGNIIAGIKSMVGKAADAAKGVAEKIGRFLGFHSPAKEGPGADADKWMPNLIKMLNNDLRAGIPQITATLNTAMVMKFDNISARTGAWNNTSAQSGNRPTGSGITQFIEIHSPTPLTPSEVARKHLQASRQLAMEWGM